MGPNSDRPGLPAATYWRRRFIALLVGMSVFALVAWAFSGAVGASRAAGSPGHSAGHSTPAGTSATARTSPSGSPSPTTSATHRPTAKKKAKPDPAKTTTASKTTHKATSGRRQPQPCPAGAVVLSLFSSQGSYATGQSPQFQIDVVSTASQSCTFDIGARHVVLQVAAGPKPVWTSAQCAEGSASLIATLHRGVPTVVPMTWNGRRSSPGCPVPGAVAGRGTYAAIAVDGALKSNAITFTLS
jgi:hypothetical protein